jgi:glycosyltransferase involved in cell wall biosynthesis
MEVSVGDRLAEIHFFEPTGYGGIFQHACRIAECLSQNGRRVVFHTGHQHEDVALEGVDICECSWWPRSADRSSIRNLTRRFFIAIRLLAVTLPHLLKSMPPKAILHVQGIAPSGVLNWLIMYAMRLAGHRIVYSPHDTFSRRGAIISAIDNMLLRLAYRPAQAIIVYSQADKQRLAAVGSRVHLSPLIQLVPRPSAAEELGWRREWQADGTGEVVLIAGFIRPERRLDLLIESARHWPKGRLLAVVGPDWGDWARCSNLAQSYNVDIAARVEFVELEQFAAAIAAADLVVVPTDVASQSGVLALARELGTPTIAANVGGLGELATRTFVPGDVADLTRVIQAEFDEPSAIDPVAIEMNAVESHLRAYGQSA